MMQDFILSPITLDALETRLVNRFKSELQTITPPKPKKEEELFSSRQAAKFLGVSLVTLHKWKVDGLIKFYRIGTRIRFKRSEVLEALQTTAKKKGGRNGK